MTNSETDTSLVKLLDFGGFMDINNSLLKQIRQDFMLLPFQAIEVQLANVIPVDGGTSFSFSHIFCIFDTTIKNNV